MKKTKKTKKTKNKYFVIVSIPFILILWAVTYTLIGSINVEKKMNDYLTWEGQGKEDIHSMEVTHSFFNIILGYDEWNIKVIYADELTSQYFYIFKDGEIRKAGISGTSEKEDLKY